MLADGLRNPVVLGCAALLVVFYGVMACFPTAGGLVLPLVFSNAFTVHFFIWTVLTASFTEASVVKLAVDLALLLLVVARLLDGLMDPLRLALLTVVAAVGSAVATSVAIFVGYVITRWEDLFFAPTYGFAGVLMAYLVLIKQRAPTEAALPGGVLPSFRAQHLPFAWLCCTLAARLVLGGGLVQAGGFGGGIGLVSDLPLAFWSLFVSWAYLRFLAHNPDGSVGDAGHDDFRFVALFPRAVEPYLGPLANFCYGVSVLCGFCKDRELAMAAQLLDDGDGGGSGGVTGAGKGLSSSLLLAPQRQGLRPLGNGGEEAGDPSLGAGAQQQKKVDPVAERRKAKAMKVLDARLKSMSASGASSAPAAAAAAKKPGNSKQAAAAAATGDDEDLDLEASTSKETARLLPPQAQKQKQKQGPAGSDVILAEATQVDVNVQE